VLHINVLISQVTQEATTAMWFAGLADILWHHVTRASLSLQTKVEVFNDANFNGNWPNDTAGWDTDMAQSQTSFIVACAGCPVHCWARSLITKVSWD